MKQYAALLSILLSSTIDPQEVTYIKTTGNRGKIKNAISIERLKQIAQELGILKLDIGEDGGRVLFNDKPNIDPMKIMALVQKRPWEFKIKGQDKLYFEYEAMEELEQRVQWAKRLFNDIKIDEAT